MRQPNFRLELVLIVLLVVAGVATLWALSGASHWPT